MVDSSFSGAKAAGGVLEGDRRLLEGRPAAPSNTIASGSGSGSNRIGGGSGTVRAGGRSGIVRTGAVSTASSSSISIGARTRAP